MDANALLGELRRTALADADAVLATARREADALLQAARERIRRQRAHSTQARHDALKRARDTAIELARSESGRTTLAARERFVQRVIDAARAESASRLKKSDSTAWLRETLADVTGFFPEGALTVRGTHPDVASIARLAAPEREWRVETLQHSPGVEVESVDASIRVDATIDRFLRAERPRLAQILTRRVEPDQP